MVMDCLSLVSGRVSRLLASVGVLALWNWFQFPGGGALSMLALLGFRSRYTLGFIHLLVLVLSVSLYVDPLSFVEFYFFIIFYKSGIGDPLPRSGWWEFYGSRFFKVVGIFWLPVF